jgi:hypothetical protein
MSNEQEAEPTRQVVLQRIRNRIVEYLELTSSFVAQREYQSHTPVHVPHEIINQWEDCVPDPSDPAFAGPVFSVAERDAISRFHKVWDEMTSSTPEPLPTLDALFETAEWQRLRDSALEALQVFLVRGRLPENQEISVD